MLSPEKFLLDTKFDKENKALTRIFNALSHYENKLQNKTLEMSDVKNIIEDCELFLNKFNKKKIADIIEYHHQTVISILEIQKKAVLISLFPLDFININNSFYAKQRWLLLKNIFFGSRGTILKESYLWEPYFNGKMAVKNWLNKAITKESIVQSYESIEQMVKLRPEWMAKNIIYPDDISNYELKAHDKKLYFSDETLFDTQDKKGNFYIFVMTHEDRVYVHSHVINFYHSSFTHGKPVKSAGIIFATNGHLTMVQMLSGHYKPGRKELLNILHLFKNKFDINLETVIVKEKPGSLERNALKYLSTKGYCLPIDRIELQLFKKPQMNFELTYLKKKLQDPESNIDEVKLLYKELQKVVLENVAANSRIFESQFNLYYLIGILLDHKRKDPVKCAWYKNYSPQIYRDPFYHDIDLEICENIIKNDSRKIGLICKITDEYLEGDNKYRSLIVIAVKDEIMDVMYYMAEIMADGQCVFEDRFTYPSFDVMREELEILLGLDKFMMNCLHNDELFTDLIIDQIDNHEQIIKNIPLPNFIFANKANKQYLKIKVPNGEIFDINLSFIENNQLPLIKDRLLQSGLVEFDLADKIIELQKNRKKTCIANPPI